MRRLARATAALLAMLSLVPSQAVRAALTACATPGRDGDATLTGGAIVNTYYPGSASVAAGATSITLGASDTRGATTPIAVGDLLLVVQVQGATINSNNTSAYGGGGTAASGQTTLAPAGYYEYVRAASAVPAAGGTLTLGTALANSYAYGAPSTTVGATTTPRRRFMVIRVPQYRNLTVTSASAPTWNGEMGGIVALDASGTMTISATGAIDMSQKGFRGGGGVNSSAGTAYAVAGTPDYATTQNTNGAHGEKGEGLAGTPYLVFDGTNITTLTYGQMPGSLDAARGAPANAGGGATDGMPSDNEQNAGGGGGGNAGAGGQGGYAWCSNYNNANGCSQSGGYGGVAETGGGKALLFFGGGGGAGSMNNNTGNPSGAPGGGAILLRAGTLAGTGTVLANGGTFASGLTNDGAGGGGAGGTIQIFARAYTGAVTATANGGAGMSNTGTGVSHGPGGGGGGGYVVSNVAIATSATGGANGTTASSTAYGTSYGATAGGAGTIDTGYASTSIPGAVYSGAECTPTVTKAFSPTTIGTGGNSRFTITVANPNPTLALSSMTVADPYPSGLVNGAAPAGSTTCTGGTVTAQAGGTSGTLSGASVAAASSCTYSAGVTSATAASYVNTVAAGGVTGTMGGGSVRNATAASATLTVTPGLTIQKTVKTIYDPVNQYTNPKAIPGAYVQYSLTVSNPGSLAVNSNTVVLGDVLPANLQLITASVYTQQNSTGARGPFQYLDGTNADGSAGTASGLTFTFNTLADTTDSPSFSSDGSTYTYSPTTNAANADPAVKAIRFQMFGTMAANSVFTVNFLMLIN